MTTASVIATTVAIEKVSTVAGRDGPQWELQVKWPWSTRIPDKIWLDKKTWPDEPVLGAWPAQIEKRGLKRKADGNDYDGSQGWMYNYKLVAFGKPASVPSGNQEPAKRGPDTVEDDALDEREWRPAREGPPPLPQALGACQNHAMAFIQSGIIPVPQGRDPINFLWELRDRVYRNVNQKPFQNEHYCYQHQAMREKSPRTDAWGHVLEDGKGCVEPQGQE